MSDKKTLELIQEVRRQKREIEKAEKPNWLTNCSFSYSEGSESAKTVNLHQESNVRNLVMLVAFLLEREKSYKTAIAELKVDCPAFSWGGFATTDWISDVKTRIAKIQIASKRKKLEVLEGRLNNVISPELRAQMELEDIQNELGA